MTRRRARNNNRSHSPSQDERPLIVIFEERAHLDKGHFSNAFADVADGFVAAGYDVEAIGPLPWARAGERTWPWEYTSYGRFHRLCYRVIIWARDLRLFGEPGLRARKAGRAYLVGRSITARCRHLRRQPLGVVIFASEALSPRVLERTGAHRRQIVHDAGTSDLLRLRPVPVRHAPDGTGAGTVWGHASRDWTRSVAAQSLGRGGAARLDICCIREVTSNREQARRELGIDQEAKVALVFGGGHEGQRPRVVLDALRQDDEWLLLTGGGIASALDGHDLDEWCQRPVIRSGYQKGAAREQLFAAADVVILSTTPTFERDSGVLTDSISHRRPVIATRGSAPAERVEDLQIGALFDAEDPASLTAALRELNLDHAQGRMDAAMERYSGTAIASAHLTIFEWLRDGKPEPLPFESAKNRWSTAP